MRVTKRLQGTIKRHPDGFGFLIPTDSDHPDVFLSRGDMVGIMTNDKVEIDVLPSDQKNKFYGKVVKILERGTKRVVGTYRKQNNGDGILDQKTSQWGMPLLIPYKNSRGASDGELVAVEIVQFPEKGQDFTGRVVEIIGDANNPINDIKRVAHLHNLPREFPAAAKHEAERLADHVLPQEIQGRKDLRELPLITIDGVTAKDFDDAVYVKTNPKGFHLWVAIADVSHYVHMGSAIDETAYERGTSTYFPNYVIPMLPEELSNELCSLKPHVDRLCFVCEMQITFQGDVESAEVYEAVMHSQARVTYGEAQDILSGENEHKNPAVTKNIRTASDLAKILMAKRYREGSLDLQIGETEVVVDDSGKPVDIIRAERVFAHKLIEELMLIANVSVAKILHAANIPALYRIHEQPDQEDIEVVERFLGQFGYKKRIGSNDIQKKLTKGLQQFEGKPEGIVLSILTLRSMKQAKYSEENVGHFGLGFEYYTHFTSPIRRYPDLIVHRLLKSLKIPKYKSARLDMGKLATAGAFLSACEQRSVKAERQLISIKKARFMSDQLGNVFEGVISSVTKFGVFVLLRQFDVDGLVKLDDLSREPLEFDEENLLLRGKKSGRTFRIGDAITIQVANVNTEEGQIDFVLEGAEGRAADRAKGGDKRDARTGKTPYQAPSKGRQERFNDSKGGGKSRGSKKFKSRDGKNRGGKFGDDKFRDDDSRDFKSRDSDRDFKSGKSNKKKSRDGKSFEQKPIDPRSLAGRLLENARRSEGAKKKHGTDTESAAPAAPNNKERFSLAKYIKSSGKVRLSGRRSKK